MKKNKLLIICILTGIISLITGIISILLYNSGQINYLHDELVSTNIKGQVDELYEDEITYSELRELIYPVGSIYVSVTDDTVAKVHERFGGTWESFGAGRTIIGVGTGTDTNSTNRAFAINTTGGEYTHKLTTTEIPSHNHTLQFNNGVGTYNAVWFGGYSAGTTRRGINYNENAENVRILLSCTSCGNGYHNNIQPYITVYMYKRTA